MSSISPKRCKYEAEPMTLEEEDVPALAQEEVKEKNTVLILTNGSATHPITYTFNANEIAKYEIPYVQAQQSFTHNSEVVTISHPMLAPGNSHLLAYWFHHLVIGQASICLAQDALPLHQLYDFLYGSEHKHIKQLRLAIDELWSEYYLIRLNPDEVKQLRAYYTATLQLVPYFEWSSGASAKHRQLAKVLYEIQEYDTLRRLDEACRDQDSYDAKTEVPVPTYSRPLALGTHETLDQLSGGLWSIIRPFLNTHVRMVSFTTFLWFQLKPHDLRPPGPMALHFFTLSIEGEDLFISALQSFAETVLLYCATSREPSRTRRILCVEDASIYIVIFSGNHKKTVDCDVTEAMYDGGETVYVTARAARAWHEQTCHHIYNKNISVARLLKTLNFRAPLAYPTDEVKKQLEEDQVALFLPLSVLTPDQNFRIWKQFIPASQVHMRVPKPAEVAKWPLVVCTDTW